MLNGPAAAVAVETQFSFGGVPAGMLHDVPAVRAGFTELIK